MLIIIVAVKWQIAANEITSFENEEKARECVCMCKRAGERERTNFGILSLSKSRASLHSELYGACLPLCCFASLLCETTAPFKWFHYKLCHFLFVFFAIFLIFHITFSLRSILSCAHPVHHALSLSLSLSSISCDWENENVECMVNALTHEINYKIWLVRLFSSSIFQQLFAFIFFIWTLFMRCVRLVCNYVCAYVAIVYGNA